MNSPIILPFPPASLSGHNTGHWRSKAGIVAKHRLWAQNAARAANCIAPRDGDILITVTFIPPDNRGDRTNYSNRLKPYFDGIADALVVNDRRFIPRYYYAKPQKPGQVQIVIGASHEGAFPYSDRVLADLPKGLV